MGLRQVRPRIATLDTRAAKPPPKQADTYYFSPEHLTWREAVIARADGRCEWRGSKDGDGESGVRCAKARPRHRMFANHKVERRDDPALALDVANGNCLCGSHHTIWTARQRALR